MNKKYSKIKNYLQNEQIYTNLKNRLKIIWRLLWKHEKGNPN